MTHPHQLHALAALWSLRNARRRLHHEIELSDRSLAIDPTVSLRSPRYGSRHGSGGHSDPIGDALISATRRANRWDQLATSTTATLTWLAGKVGAAGPGDPLGRLFVAVPDVRPSTAAELHHWLTEADHDIRKALGVDADRQPLPGIACPSCGIRQLEAQTSARERTHWTVICTAGCRCAGGPCTCGMPTTELGVTHIWDAASALVVRHLDRLAA